MKNKIKEIIRKEFNAKVMGIKEIKEGYSHYMYDVKINKKPCEVIIRFSNNIEQGVSIMKEKDVMNLMSKKKIPVPKIYAFYFPEKDKKKSYLILEKFKSKRLDTIWHSLSLSEKKQITKEIGKLLLKIHSIKFNEFGELREGLYIKPDKSFQFRKQGNVIEYSSFLRQLFVESFKDLARLISYKIVKPDFFSKFMLYLTKNLDKFDYKGKPVLIHNDFMIGHLFVEGIKGEYKITGLIDFEFAYSHSPEYDFIKLHRQGFFEDLELKKSLLQGYGKINEKAVEIYRLIRDMGFAQVMLDCGDNKTANKIIRQLEYKLDKELK